ncbi:ATP-dependent zinc protease family protein [Yoonia maritima]|uniref:ATP-dependent zinc protease family protein n=1 Tax=Yoonia maritima TaxID=1435347 RepID=UPI000D1075EA|nr:RimK/LysX family protein [Yoonia maritima]
MANLNMKMEKSKRELLVIGWMEHLDLPELGLNQIKAKIDTGARTSALHAIGIEPFDQDGEDWVRFQVQLDERAPLLWVEAKIHDRREIKNTSGISEERIVIQTLLKLTDRSWPIAVSLTDRTKMTFPMIVGRTALKNHNIAVHTRRANLIRKLGRQSP